MKKNYLSNYYGKEIISDDPILLFESENHKIYWLGIEEYTAFRTNVYLIEDKDEYIIVDPGSKKDFAQVKSKVSKITDPKNVTGMILCHQDPDVAASMVDWLDLNDRIKVFTSARVNVLLPYYGKSEYDFFDISGNSEYKLKSGNLLKFVESPFLHFPGAFTTLDINSGFLFSGDIWAALDIDWKLIVDDFESHTANMDLFHLDYMASNIAARGFVKNVENEKIEAILPQHASIMDKKDVQNALEYLKNLQCGTDIIYGDLD